MDFEVYHKYPPGDPILVDKIVCHLKAQGIFDNFRKECLSDVDTKPAYQNLRQRVDGSVAGYLAGHKWKPDLNKNQLRESLRKYIQNGGFLEVGVERIVDQVVNPKIGQVFLPRVRDVVLEGLGLKEESDSHASDRPAINNHKPSASSSSTTTSTKSSSTFTKASSLTEIDDSEENATSEKEPESSEALEVKKEDESASEKVLDSGATVASEMELEPAIKTEESANNFETHIETRSSDSSDTRISGISDLTSVKSISSLRDLNASDDEDDDNDDAIVAKSVDIDDVSEVEKEDKNDDKLMTSANDDDIQDSLKSQQSSNSNYEKSYPYGFLSEFSTQEENVEIETDQIGTSVVECVTTSENIEEDSDGRESANSIAKNIEINYDSDSNGDHRKEIDLQQTTEVGIDYHDDNHDNNDVHDNNDEAENYYEESSRDLSSFQKEESNFEESQSEADIEKCDSISNEMKFSGNIEDETFLETEDESFKSQRKEKKIGEERKYRKEKERKHHSKHKLSEGHHDSSSGESRDDRKPRKSWHSTDKERQFRDGDSRSSSLEGKLGKGDDNLDFKHRRSRHDKDATYDQEEVSKSESVEKKEQKSEIEYHKERHSRPKERKSVSKEKSHGDEYEEAKFDQVESCVSESDEKNEYKEEVKYSYKDRHVRSRGHKTTSKEKTRDDVYKKETFDEEASKSESDEINKFQGKVEYSHKERHGRSRSHKTTSKEKAHVDEFEEETSVCESDEKIKYGEKVEYSIRERHSRSRDHKTASKDKTSDDEYEEEMFDQEEASKSESDDRKEYQDEDEYSRKERHTRSRDHKKATREKTHVDEYEGAAFDQEKSGKCESDEKSKHQEKVGYSHKGKHSHSRSHRTPAKERGHDDKYKEDARSKCYQEETGKSDSDDRKGYQNEDEYSHKERRTRSRDHVKAAKESMNVDEYERPAFDQEETSKGESDDKNKYQDEVEYSHKEKHSRSRGHKTVSKEIPQTDQYEEEEAFNQEEACKSESDERKECQYDVEYSYKERSTRSRGHKKAFKEKAHVDQYDPEEPSKCESNEKNENQENVEYSHKERHSRSRRHKTTSKEKFHDEYEEASFEQEEDEEGSLMELYEKKEFEDEVEYSHKEKKHTRSRGSINACKEKSEGVEYKEEMLDQEETSIKDSEERSRFHEKVESSHKERHSRSRDHRNTYKEKSHDDNRKHRKEEERHHRSDSDKKKHGSSSKRKHKSQDEIKEDRSHQSSSSHHRSSRDKHSRRQLEKCVEENQEIENNNDDNGRKDKDKGKKSRDNCKPADKSRDHRRSADGDSSGAADNRSLGSADSSRHTRSDRSKTKEKSGHKSGGKSSSSSTSDALPTSNVLEHNNSEQHNVEESVVNVSETIIQPSFQTIDPSMDDNGIFYIDKENSSCSDERFVSEEDGDSRICQERTETNEGENSNNEEQGEKIIKLGTEKSANDVSKITMDIEIPEISNNKSEFQKESEFSTNNEQTNLDENLSSNEWAIEHVKNSESQEQINLVKGEEADKMVNNIDAKQEEKSNSGAESQEIYTSNPKSQSVFTLQNVETQVPKDGDTKVRKKRFAANIAEARKIMRERRRYEKKLQKKHLSLCDSSVIDQSSTMNQNVVCNQTEIEEKEIVEKNVECSNENSVPIPNVPNESTEFVEETAQNQDEVEINLKYKRPKLAANIYEVRKIIKARKRLRRMEKKRLNISKRGESSVNQQTVDGEFKTQFEDDEKHKIQNTINTTEAISTTCTRRQLGSKVAKIVLNKQDCDSKDAVNTVNDADNLITLKIKSQECLESGSENVECKSSLSYEDINQLASKCLVVKLNKLDDENLVKKENELANSIETSNQSDFQDVHANKELPLQDINKENILQFDSNYDSHEVGSHECRSENEKHDSLETITTEDQECGLYNESKCNAVMKVESMTNMTKTEIFDSDVTENLSSGKSTIDTIKFENSSTLETIGLADDVAGLVSGEKSQSVSIAAHVESSDSSETTAVVDDITKSNSNESKSVEVPEDEGFGASETIILEDNRTESHSCEKPKPVGEALNVEFGILETLGSGIDRIESNSFEKFTPVNKVESSSRVKTTVSGIVPDENDSSNGLTYPPKNESSSPSKIIFSGVGNSIEIVSKSSVEAPDVCKVIDSHKNIENEANNRISTLNEDSCFEKSFCYFEQNETDDSKERFEKFKLFLNAFEKDVKYLEDMEKTDLVTSDFALDRKFDSYLEKECGFQVLRKDCILLPSLNDENYYFDKESDCYYLKNRLVDKSEISNKNLNVHQQKLSDNNRKVLLSGRSSRSVGEKRSTRKKSVFQEQRKSPVKLRISIRNPNSSAIETEEINVPYTSDVESSIDGSAGRISVDSRKSVEDGVSENEPNNSDNPLRASTPLQDAESGTVQKPCDEISHSATSFKSTKRRRGHNRRKKSSNSPETVRCHQEFKIKTCPEAENNNLPSAEGAANLNSFKITLSRNNNSSNLSRIVAPQSPSSQSNTFLANNVPSSIDAAVPSESESRFIIGKRHSSKTDSFEESRRSPKKKYDSTFSDSDFKKTEQAIETVTDSLNNSLEDEADISHDESMTSNMIGEALKNLIAESGLVPTTPQLSSTKHETKEEPACARVTRHQRSQKKNDPPEDTERPVKRIRNSERLSAGVKLPRRYENTDFYKPRLDVGQGNRRKRKPDEPGLDSLVDNGPSRKRKLSNVVGPARRSSR